MILTPDQRLRVFVSSTLQELAEERAAASRAIESLRLIPVLFETGARPHPPRDLYRAYLEQSHIFVGIYWQRYGWIAPDMEISGLEDEYRLSGDRPKLLYIKESTGEREAGLVRLLDVLQNDTHASVRRFRTAAELETMVKDDLALMLTERFESGGGEGDAARALDVTPLPIHLDPVVAREHELGELKGLLEEGARLITLTGPGGVGKSRLATALAHSVASSFPDGVVYVALSPIRDAELVGSTIAQALGLKGSGGEAPVTAVSELIGSRRLLMVIDNFEHVMPATKVVSELLTECPELRVVVTSRELLRIRGEHQFQVPPLRVPEPGADDKQTSAVRLFLDRASAARPDTSFDDGDLRAIGAIVRAVDGLPLAIELAAARIRLMPPRMLLQRLSEGASALFKGTRDMPERQRTLEATIRWSYDLLGEDERRLFTTLGVFPGGFTLEAVEAVCTGRGDVLENLASLLDKSMVRVDTEATAEPRFVMLRTIHDFAAELLAASGDLEEVRAAHGRYYIERALSFFEGLRSAEQRSLMHHLEVELDNHRASMEWALGSGRADLAAATGWAVWLFWWANGHLSEGREWMQRALESPDLPAEHNARALAVLGAMAFWQGDLGTALPTQIQALEAFEGLGDRDGVAITGMAVGIATALMGDPETGRARLRASREHLLDSGDRWGAVTALNALCWLQELLGDTDRDEAEHRRLLEEAYALGADVEIANALANNGYLWNLKGDLKSAASFLGRSLEIFQSLRNKGSAWYILDRAGELAAKLGDPAAGARIIGASARMKEQIQAMPVANAFEKLEAVQAAIVDEIGAAAFDRAFGEGQAMGFDEALTYARERMSGAIV